MAAKAQRQGSLYNATLRAVLYTWVLLAVVVTNFAHAQESTFPELTGRVVDLAGLLDEAAETALTAQLAAHEEETSNQIVVVTVPSLNGYDITDYANRLGRLWQIGTSEEDNGVLLVVAPNDRKVRIEVGYGLEGALTDSLSSIIIQREILPAFKDNDYATGIKKGTDAILKAVAGEYTVPTKTSDQQSSGSISKKLGNFLPLIFIAVFAIPQILRRTSMGKAANSAFPAGFGGLFGTLITGNVFIGIGIAVSVFLFIYFAGSGKGGSGGSTRRDGYIGGGSLGGGDFGGGGGFSGGGGSFGGGGASGDW